MLTREEKTKINFARKTLTLSFIPPTPCFSSSSSHPSPFSSSWGNRRRQRGSHGLLSTERTCERGGWYLEGIDIHLVLYPLEFLRTCNIWSRKHTNGKMKLGLSSDWQMIWYMVLSHGTARGDANVYIGCTTLAAMPPLLKLESTYTNFYLLYAGVVSDQHCLTVRIMTF